MAFLPRRALVLAALIALGVPIAASAPVGGVADPASTIFINELHYDNVGTDAGEAVEVAAPAGTNLAGWTIVLYNGTGGAVYNTFPLTGVVPDQGGGSGTISTATMDIQNGSPDGLALVDPGGAVEQFLSYEGAFTAGGGPADGLTSTNIGVAEPTNAPVGTSLALTGTGDAYGDFTWTAAGLASFGAINPGQTFSTSGPATPVATCPAALVTPAGTAASADVSATDTDSAIVSIVITSPQVEGITLTATGPGTARLDVAATTIAGSYDVVIEFATDDDPAQTTACTVEVTVDSPPKFVRISEIQGGGPASLLVGEDVAAEAVVTSLFTSRDADDGFFLQEEDADVDADPTTSEGIFVFCRGACPAGVAAGDLVRVTGTVAEFFGMTQIDARAFAGGSFTTVSRGNPLPTATPVALPAAGSTRAEATFENVEGMVATFPDTLVVSEYFELARFGQLVLTVDERPYQFTHDDPPSVAGYQAFLTDLATRRIILDDDNNDQNDAVTDGPDEEYPYPTGGLAIDNRFRGGDTVTDLTGVLHWSFAGQSALPGQPAPEAWRIRPIPDVDYSFESVNVAPPKPDVVGRTLKVATFNVLNSFSTIDETPSNNSGPCGPSGTLDCRGADSTAELVRQRAKIVSALAAMDADVVGLIEIQNDAGASTLDLVAALNDATNPGTYAAVDTGFIGTDAIKVAFIYQPASVTPVGPYKVLTSAVDPRFIDNLNRPALIQTFEEVGTGERLTVAVNHFKSKGSNCDAVGDPDTLDGQGNCAVTRTNAASALADYLATDPTGSGDPDFLIVGDLNSYRRENPITTLVGAGYTDLIKRFVGDDAYSFVFDGQLGYLDHALATESLVGQVTGATEWAINADEVPLFDYNDDVRDPGEAAFERESTVADLYLPDARRSSDHDPLVVGLDLDGTPNTLTIDDAVILLRPGGGGTVVLSGRVAGEVFASCPVLDLRIDGFAVVHTPTTRIGQTCAALTSQGVVTFNLSTGRIGGVLTLPRSFVLADDTVNFTLTLDDEQFVADVSGRRRGRIWTAD